MSILVGGGTGQVGSAVVRALSSAGATVKLLTRDESSDKVKPLTDLAGVTIVKGDFCDSASLPSAFEGVKAAFLGCSNSEAQVAAEKGFIDAAEAAGCKYLVKLSTCGVEGYKGKDSIIQYGRYHTEIEDHLASTKLLWTVLCPNDFMQNHMGDIFGTLPLGIVAYPMPPSSSATIVDTRDVGDVAAKFLLEEDYSKHAGKQYDVCGPESISTEQLAKMYTSALGRDIAAVECTAEEWAGNAEKAGFPTWLAQAVSRNFADFWGKGKLDYPSSQAVLDLCAPQRTMQAWISEHAPLSPPPASP